MSLTVVATITAKPGSEEAVRTALSTLTAASRRDDGCLSYALFQSAGDSAVFITVEEWESQAHLDAHMKAPHLREAAGAIGSELAKPFEVHPLTPVAV